MKRKKVLLLASCIALLSGVVFTGCGSTNSSVQNNVTESSTESEEDSLQESVGFITNIDADNNTVTIEEMRQMSGAGTPPNTGSTNGEESPEKPDGDSTEQTDSQPPTMPSGDSSNQNGDQPPTMPTGDSSNQNGDQPPTMPSGDSSNQNGNQPPEMPNVDSSNQNGTQPPEMPTEDSTEQTGSQPPNMPSGEFAGQGNMPSGNSTTFAVTDDTVITDEDGNPISLSELTENTFVSYTAQGDTLLTLTLDQFGAAPSGNMGAMGNMGGGVAAPSEYASVVHYTSDSSESSVSQDSTGTDESIAWISDGATVDLADITATKESNDSTGGDQSSFYGVGAAYLVTDGTLNISGSTISTDSAGGAGVFAYGDGVANVSDCTITTNQGTSGGIHVAGGGTLNASNLTVETNGASSAAIRSDRGSGTMTVNGGTYTSNGTGSPAVYSTAEITVSDAVLTATNSEAVCIEGKNSLTLTDCDLSSNMPDNEQNDCKWSVILYQSMSGDSEVGTSTFSMTGGSMNSSSGGLFYTTNTNSEFTLDSVDISTADTPDFFLKCTGNSNQRGWGTAGQNGANCTFTAINQEMKGDIIWDSISTLELNLTKGSTLEGAIVDDESNAGNGGTGYATVIIDADSTWIVTGDSIVTTLENEGTIRDENGDTVSIVGTDGTVYEEGNSPYTITVENDVF